MKINALTKEKLNRLYPVLWFLLGLLTLAGMVKSVLVSIDIDESYAIAQSYRLIRHDRFLADMWEPHQLSGYLSAIFLKGHELIFGTMDYAVISLRVIGTIIHFLVGLFLCRTLKSFVSKTTNIFLFFLHMNFLAKWITLPEFELMHYWLFLIMALCLIRFYLYGKNNVWLLVSGLCLVLQMMNYPTMLLLYPVYLFGIYRMSTDKQPGSRSAEQKEKKYSRENKLIQTGFVKQGIFFTLGAGVPGVVFLGYLLSYMNLSQFQSNLAHIMSDPSHTTRSFGARMGEFGLEFVIDVLILGIAFWGCYGIVMLIGKVFKKETTTKSRLCFYSLLLEILIFSLIQMVGCVLFDQNQFFLQERYLVFALGGFLLFWIYRKGNTLKEKLLYYFLLLPAAFSLLATLMLTNMSANVSYTKLFPCIFVILAMWDTYEKKERELSGKESFWNELLLYVPVLAVLGSLLVCRLLLIRVTGCLPVTIKAPLQEVTQGPLKGTYIHKEFADAWENNCTLLRTYCTADDNLFYFGSENLLYLCTDANISVASVQGTSVFDQSFLDYLTEHPDKYPTAVAVDLRYKSVYEYRYSPFNYVVADWIEKDYSYTEKIETPTMILYLNR